MCIICLKMIYLYANKTKNKNQIVRPLLLLLIINRAFVWAYFFQFLFFFYLQMQNLSFHANLNICILLELANQLVVMYVAVNWKVYRIQDFYFCLRNANSSENIYFTLHYFIFLSIFFPVLHPSASSASSDG